MTRKRGQGEGSIYKRKSGLWTAQIRLEGRKLYKYARTQAEARDWLQETRNQIQHGLTLSAAQLTIGQFLQQWLASYTASVRPKTHEQYSQIVRRYVSPAIGSLRLKDLRPDHIQYLYSEMLRYGKSERTVGVVHAVLHRALNQALAWGMIGRNPAQAVSKPRLRRREMKTLTDSQVRILLHAASKTNLEALFWLAVTTGMRQSEMLGLKWDDLDWSTRRLSIQRQLQRVSRQGLIFTEPKTAAGKRSVVIGGSVMTKLRAHRAVQSYERLFCGDRWHDSGLIFVTPMGTPLDHRNLFKYFKAILKEAHLPNIRFHDLRHTAATLMLQQNVNPKVVQERLGHSDISLTLNTYSHVLPAMQEQAAQTLDALLSDPPPARP